MTTEISDQDEYSLSSSNSHTNNSHITQELIQLIRQQALDRQSSQSQTVSQTDRSRSQTDSNTSLVQSDSPNTDSSYSQVRPPEPVSESTSVHRQKPDIHCQKPFMNFRDMSSYQLSQTLRKASEFTVTKKRKLDSHTELVPAQLKRLRQGEPSVDQLTLFDEAPD